MIEKSRTIRQKSPKFPAIGIDRAVVVLAEASKHGKSFKRETFASFGLRRDSKGSVKSGAYIRRMAALKYFGLIEEKGDRIEFTELADSIIFPKSENEKKRALVQSFLNPTLFQKLYDSTLKNTPVKREELANVALREFGVTPGAKQEFISSFVNSAKFVGLLRFSDEGKSIILIESEGISHQDPEMESFDEEVAKSDWSMMINKKDKRSNYELRFRSKEMLSGDLLNELNTFIKKLEEEFQVDNKVIDEQAK